MALPGQCQNTYNHLRGLFFDHLPTSTWTFFTLNVDQNWPFLTTYPSHLVFERPLIPSYTEKMALTIFKRWHSTWNCRLWKLNEIFFHRNPRALGLGWQFRQITFGTFGVFLADLSASILVLFFIIQPLFL